MALALTTGSGLFVCAVVSCAFVIAVLWLLESLGPPARSRFELTIAAKSPARLQPDLEHALGQKGVSFELHWSLPTELIDEVTVPFPQKVRPLTTLIQQLGSHDGMLVEWDIKQYETVRP